MFAAALAHPLHAPADPPRLSDCHLLLPAGHVSPAPGPVSHLSHVILHSDLPGPDCHDRLADGAGGVLGPGLQDVTPGPVQQGHGQGETGPPRRLQGAPQAETEEGAGRPQSLPQRQPLPHPAPRLGECHITFTASLSLSRVERKHNIYLATSEIKA